jgi:hypothetical protein
MENKLFSLKLKIQDSENTDELYKYASDVLCADLSLPTTVTQEERYVLVESTLDVLELIAERLIEDYATLGYEIEQDLDLFDLVVYCNEPELNNHIVQNRININQAQLDAICDCMGDTNKSIEKVGQLATHIDVQNTFNGAYKLRHIIGCMIDALEKKGIFVEEEINDGMFENVH